MADQSDLVKATKPVAEAFDALGVAYYIGGSVASSAYGLARATLDVDMVADLTRQHVRPLVKMLEAGYYLDENMILTAVAQRSSFNLIHLETMLKVDVFVLKDEAYHQISLQRRRKDTFDDELTPTEFYLVSPEDIILNKLDWYRLGGEVSERQWRDILGVLKVQRDALDMAYLQEWATRMALTVLLGRAYAEAGIEP